MRTLTQLALISLPLLTLTACNKGEETVSPDASASGDEATEADHGKGMEHHGQGMKHEGEGEAHAHDFAPEVAAFHDVMKPNWHAEPGEARTAATCDAVPEFKAKAQGIGEGSAPEGVEAGAWTQAAAGLSAAVQSLETSCGGDRSDFDASFKSVHDAFHALIKLTGHGGKGHGGKGEGHGAAGHATETAG